MQRMFVHWLAVFPVTRLLPGGSLLAVCALCTGCGWEVPKGDGKVGVEEETQDTKPRFTLEAKLVRSIAFSADGKLLAGTVNDRVITVWEVETRKPKVTLWTGPELAAVAFSPDGKTLAAGVGDIFSNSGEIQLWDLAASKKIMPLKGHASLVWSLAFTRDGNRLASGSWDGTLRIWEMPKGDPFTTIKVSPGPIFSVAFSPDAKLVACGAEGKDGTVTLWEVAKGKLKANLKGHPKVAWSVAFSPDGNLLASGGDDKVVRVWEVATGRLKAVLKGHKWKVTSVAFSPDGKLVASGAGTKVIAGTGKSGGEVKLWEVATEKELGSLKGQGSFVSCVTFNPANRQVLASGSREGGVELWEVPVIK